MKKVFKMTRLGLVAIACFGLLSSQCSDDRVEPVTLFEEFTLEEGSSLTLNIENSNEFIHVLVMDIEDLRCPANVQCVRYGEAKVTLGINGVQEILKTLEMCIGDCLERGQFIQADTVAVELDQKAYGVILKNVIPYPETPSDNRPKKAVLEIIRY